MMSGMGGRSRGSESAAVCGGIGRRLNSVAEGDLVYLDVHVWCINRSGRHVHILASMVQRVHGLTLRATVQKAPSSTKPEKNGLGGRSVWRRI